MTYSRILAGVDKLDPNDSRPPYRQVSDALRSAIHAGELQVGDKLPAHAAVAEKYGVSVGTVKRAYADLHDAALIVTRQGQGSYVRAVETTDVTEHGATDLYGLVESLTARVEAIERELAERRE